MRKPLALLLVALFLSSLCVIGNPTGATLQENTWVSRTSMHVARSDLGVAVVENRIYAIGGLTASGYNPNSEGVDYKARRWITNTNEEYDSTSKEWVFKASMPTSRYDFAIASFQGKVYCFGGMTNWNSGGITLTNETEVYDPSTDTWSTKASMPTAVIGQANVLGNKIYVISGTLNQVYDPANDLWTTKASLPEEIPFQETAVMDNKIYAVGHWQDLDNHITSKTLVYDPKTDAWSSGKPIAFNFKDKGVPWRGDWNSEAIGATSGLNAPMNLYVFFMQYVYTGPLPNIQYNPKDQSWNKVADEPTNRHNFAVVNINDALFVIGGYTMYYPTPDDSLFYITPCAVTEQYFPVGYGNSDPSYLPPEAIIIPEIAIQTPQSQTYNQSDVALTFLADKALNWSGYSLDGKENMTFIGSGMLANLSIGLHNITVFANDTFGNMAASKTINFTVTLPTLKTEINSSTLIVAISISAVAAIAIGMLIYIRHRKAASLQRV